MVSFTSGGMQAPTTDTRGAAESIDRRFSIAFPLGTYSEGEAVRLVVRCHSAGLDSAILDDLFQALRHAESPTALLHWATLLGTAGALRLAIAGPVLEIEECRPSTPAEPIVENLPSESARLPDDPAHARLARELRDMTGLGAKVLGSVLGVTREQYSRWASGHAISDLRHGQLRYLHTLMADLTRRLGDVEARAWLHQPVAGGPTPVELLKTRQWEQLHCAIIQLSDPEPVVGGVIVALSAPDPEDLPNDDAEDEPWSPYQSPDAATEPGGRL
ncbi:hypothetical protein [Sphaerimonospora thailandensis]|uniref:Uncharacterized protein n=1 Tax=Sphaerimonospora thailandensis TaxID=795644 RepID=A0A8J3RDB9_9ACTN|nr:hypothetical protein [Sphaerimonospora thailandensis]GIH72201.1 hypothetical protein Mth01_44540 [Sphaerimonospora thailandensis]